jgi:hypothetical protein
MKTPEQIEFEAQHQEGIGCVVWFLRMLIIALLVTIFLIFKKLGVL